jgi:hypothetical protein
MPAVVLAQRAGTHGRILSAGCVWIPDLAVEDDKVLLT